MHTHYLIEITETSIRPGEHVSSEPRQDTYVRHMIAKQHFAGQRGHRLLAAGTQDAIYSAYRLVKS